MRHRAMAALAAALMQAARDGGRARTSAAGSTTAPAATTTHDRGGEHHDRGLDALALPGDGDVAGALGDTAPERDEPDDDERTRTRIMGRWGRGGAEFLSTPAAGPYSAPVVMGPRFRGDDSGESQGLSATPRTAITCRAPRAHRRRGGGWRRARPRACTCLIQGSAAARSAGGSFISSASAPEDRPAPLSPRCADDGGRIAPATSATGLRRTSSARPAAAAKPSRGAGRRRPQRRRQRGRARARARRRWARPMPRTARAGQRIGSAPSARRREPAANGSPRSTADLSAVAASASLHRRGHGSAAARLARGLSSALSLRSSAATRWSRFRSGRARPLARPRPSV
jgi:hypothetical protein